MDNVVTNKAVKRFFPVVILLCFCTFMFTGCEEMPGIQIGRQAGKIMKCIANKDKEGLFGYFAQDRKTERKEETMNEINIALDSVIDGNIVSYKYDGDGGGADAQSYGEIRYYHRFPTFCNVKTDTGKTYMITIFYYHVWRDHPEFEGIRYIDIYEDMLYGHILHGVNRILRDMDICEDYESAEKHLFAIGGEFDPHTDKCDGLPK